MFQDAVQTAKPHSKADTSGTTDLPSNAPTGPKTSMIFSTCLRDYLNDHQRLMEGVSKHPAWSWFAVTEPINGYPDGQKAAETKSSQQPPSASAQSEDSVSPSGLEAPLSQLTLDTRESPLADQKHKAALQKISEICSNKQDTQQGMQDAISDLTCGKSYIVNMEDGSISFVMLDNDNKEDLPENDEAFRNRLADHTITSFFVIHDKSPKKTPSASEEAGGNEQDGDTKVAESVDPGKSADLEQAQTDEE